MIKKLQEVGITTSIFLINNEKSQENVIRTVFNPCYFMLFKTIHSQCTLNKISVLWTAQNVEILIIWTY